VTGTACTSFNGTNATFTLAVTLAPFIEPMVGARPGTLVRYSVGLTPQGTTAGNGVITAFLSNGSTATGNMTAFECHNAFPGNL
jgi:hypothetical protein